jgi:hypothetical protein
MKNSSFPKNDPKYLWVCPDDEKSGNGAYDEPYGRIATALSQAKPGQVVVLGNGTYHGDVTIEASGTIDRPLRIVADNNATVIIDRSCWYFYDVCDCIVSGITFNNSPLGSIAIVGLCERNKFERLSFINCGHSPKASCTLFFGGSGASCNVVEYCNFERPLPRLDNGIKKPDDMIVGLMISEGDALEGKPITNHVVRRNKFVNYDYGILVGAEDATIKQYGHHILFNTIENCQSEGIMVKCGDTLVKGNVVSRCPNNSISVVTGEGSVVENNRIIDCGTGIRVAGRGHTISNNCIIRTGREAIRVIEKNGAKGITTHNIIIEQNTCADWSQESPLTLPAVTIASAASAIIKQNAFWGSGDPYNFTGEKSSGDIHLISDNIGAGGCATPAGVIAGKFGFVSKDQDNFDNDSGYGASGWMCRPDPYDPDKEPEDEPVSCVDFLDDPQIAEIESECGEAEDETGNDDPLLRSFFFEEDGAEK